MRTVLFHANLRNFRGAHLKLWDYFNHVLAAPGFTPRISFTAKTRWDASNPWLNARDYVVDNPNTVDVGLFFLGGRRWEQAERHPNWGPGTPVISFVQHVHHADPANERFPYLSRPAVRICVAEEVGTALRATGVVRGPVIVIPNGIDLGDVIPPTAVEPEVDVLIAALKRPEIGVRLRQRLEREGRRVRLLTERLHRSEYLRRLQHARVTVFLPNDTEGFYLPALEGLAAGTLVVCPDCIGNRGFCRPDSTAFVPSFALDDLVAATESALALPDEEAGRIRANALITAEEYSVERERAAFHNVLANIDRLWLEARAGALTAVAR
ncbi:MAG: glycosyltransferase family 1 protein [Chloroflexota bacterium]|nr:glycosyltransferase family 1 protein [Chloroflexota bacterium]